MGVLRSIGEWFEHRLRLKDAMAQPLTHPVPRSSASWWYVFGSATLTTLILQLITGVCLAFVYVPSAADAWQSLEHLNYSQPLGWFLRGMHYWGSNFMVALITLHVIRVFLFGAYKYPRELTWIVGVLLLLLTLGMAFTGQVLRWDQDAYWGLGIGAAIAGRTPFIGPRLVHLLLGGPIIGGETLTRFFVSHVFLIPALLLALVGLHLLLVLKLGISEWPMPGRLVSRERYRAEYEALLEREGVPFFPAAAQRDLCFSGLVILAVVVCAAVFGPSGPKGPPDPTLIRTVPRPDFFFLSVFAALALLPPYLETFLLLTAPVVGIALLVALPFLSNTGERSFRRRPVAVLGVILIVLTLVALTEMGESSPWSPVMNAWSSLPTPPQYVKGRTPLELQGALLVQGKQCRNCHSLGGRGGQRGPALDDVATRLTRDQLIRQVLQGGGNMPAYGKHLSPPEVTALVAFLETMHPSSEPPEKAAPVPATPAAP
jgi:ubiquinol-cytochrome c reductase cytochrome b subunit